MVNIDVKISLGVLVIWGLIREVGDGDKVLG